MFNSIKRSLLSGLKENRLILKNLIDNIPESQANRRIKDYWTIYEHVDHLVVTQKMLLGRIQQFLSEENPEMKPYVPEDKPNVEDSKKTINDLAYEFIRLRDRQIGLIKKAGSGIWNKKGIHPEYHEYGFEILIRHIYLHDSYHMWRIEELWIEKEELINELK